MLVRGDTTMKKVPRIVGIGIAVVDIYRHQKKMYPGGNEYNVAYDTKLLGADSAFMGVFANDEVGKILEKVLVEAGVDISHSHHEIGSSGYALVDLKDGDRVFIDWNKNGVTDLYPFSFNEEEILYIKTFDVASLSRASRLTHEKIAGLAKEDIAISYDFYDDFTDGDIDAIAPYIRFGFFSCSHISEKDTRKVLKKCVKMGAEIAIGTRGGLPTIAYDGKRFYEQEIYKVKATDTMGAGDSFISAFLTNYLSVEADEPGTTENKITISLQKAAEFAATVVVKDGSIGVGYDVDPDQLSEIINI